MNNAVIRSICVFFLLAGPTCNALEILLFVPGNTASIILFNSRLADILQRNGHSVTFVVSYMMRRIPTKMPENMTEIIHVEQDENNEEWVATGKELGKYMDKYAFKDIDVWDAWPIQNLLDMTAYFSCQQLLNDDLLRKFKTRKFDLVLTHFYFLCPVGIAKMLDVPVVLLSGGNYIFDHITHLLYLPYASSYNPSHLTSFSDRMDFVKRAKNLLMSVFGYPMLVVSHSKSRSENSCFQQISPHHNIYLPSLTAATPALLLNGEGMLDFPRALTHSVVYLGELAKSSFGKPLPEDWEHIVEKGKDGIILFSLGTVVPTDHMPSHWRRAFADAFKQFPTYQIIWKLDAEIEEAKNFTNVHISKWTPQRELLGHSRMRLFFTHGGYNSLLESCQAGVPVLMLPLILDQYGNARRAERLGIGLALDKHNLTAENIADAMRELLTNDRYRKRAALMSNIISDKIVPAEIDVIHWINRVAKLKNDRWSYRLSAAQRLNWFQYYSMDTAGALLTSFLSLLYAILRIANLVRLKITDKFK